MKAMLLAAGRGKRLKPLTDTTSKSLMRVGDETLIEHNIRHLKRCGVDYVVINLCYMADKIIQHLGDGSRFDITIEYSFEGEHCLGTGGGIYRALPLLGAEPFWVVSADLWTECPFQTIRLPQKSCAHLIMVSNPDYHADGDYGIAQNGQLTRHGEKVTYASMALLSPKFFEHAPGGVFPLSLLIERAIQNNCITAEQYSGVWFNVGDAAELARLRQYLQQAPGPSSAAHCPGD